MDSILKLKGGADELNLEEQEKLLKSLLAKADSSSYKETSINKYLEKIFKLANRLIDPVISSNTFWRIMSEFGKPVKSELSVSSQLPSTDILAPAQTVPDKESKTGLTGSSSTSIFAEAFFNPTRLFPIQKRVEILEKSRAINKLNSFFWISFWKKLYNIKKKENMRLSFGNICGIAAAEITFQVARYLPKPCFLFLKFTQR
jgi:hypothetical protein